MRTEVHSDIVSFVVFVYRTGGIVNMESKYKLCIPRTRSTLDLLSTRLGGYTPSSAWSIPKQDDTKISSSINFRKIIQDQGFVHFRQITPHHAKKIQSHGPARFKECVWAVSTKVISFSYTETFGI